MNFMAVLIFLVGFAVRLSIGYSPPSLDCSKDNNNRWCQSLASRGSNFFCVTKGQLTKSVCRKSWCTQCPQQYNDAVTQLQSSSLWEKVKSDSRWTKMKIKYKSKFDALGLGQYFVPQLYKDQLPRYESFLKAMDQIKNVTKQVTELPEFEFGINKFAFMTPKELAGLFGMRVPSWLKATALPPVPKTDDDDDAKSKRSLPADWQSKVKINGGTDWRAVLESTKDIKDQGMCGCCWAFSACQTLESLYELKSGGDRVSFSVQDLIDCSSNGINKGCDGGLAHFAFEYIRDTGIMPLDDYKYTSYTQNSGKGVCRHSKTDVKSFVHGFEYFYSGDTSVNHNWDYKESEERLMRILDIMPVAGTIASLGISLYKRGIYNNPKCGGPLNHAILIVGYGTSKKGTPYWIIKNTWGKDWGEGGYIRMKRGNYCGVAQYWAYPNRHELCTKFTKSICASNPECDWYGDQCDYSDSKCSSMTSKVTCDFHGCFWNKQESKCVRPTAKCVLDMELQADEGKCNEAPHCEWSKYGNCQVKAKSCQNIELTHCEANYCTKNGAECQAWDAYKCSLMFNTKDTCAGKSICAWFENSCQPSVQFCKSNTKQGETECNKIGCQWVSDTNSCGPITQKCKHDPVMKTTKEKCTENGLCDWKDSWAVCNVKAQICTEIGGTSQDVCGDIGCLWDPADKTCKQTEIKGKGVFDTACVTDSEVCKDLKTQSDCENSGCTWYGDSCDALINACSFLSTTTCGLFPLFCFKSDRMIDPEKGPYCDHISKRCLHDMSIYKSMTGLSPSVLCPAVAPYCTWDGNFCKTRSTICSFFKSSYTCELVGCKWDAGCQQVTEYPCADIVHQPYCEAVKDVCQWDSVNSKCEKKA